MHREEFVEQRIEPMPSRWSARVGLAVVAGILLSCFGLLIAASHASSSAQ